MTTDQAETWRSFYPFRSNWLPLDGSRYHYLDEGAGNPLLMVHGNPTWSFYWRKLVGPLRDEFRVVVPDHMGCGLSDKPQQYNYCLATHVANLVALIDQLDLQDITLLAHDWGGPIGLGAALARPERFGRLVLFNTGAFPPPFFPWRIRACRTPGLGRLAVQGGNLFARAALSMALADRSRLSSAERQGMLAPYDNWSNRVAIYRFVADIPASSRHPTWETLAQIEQRLPTLADRPVQLIWGMQDWCFRPACLERLIQIFPHAEVHRLPEAGHWVIEEAHEQIVPLVRSFARRSSPCP